MLVLTRYCNNSIIIGEGGEIEIKILGYSQKSGVKIGINCPKEIPVHREEVYKRIKQNGERFVKPSKEEWISIREQKPPQEEYSLFYGWIETDYQGEGNGTIEKEIIMGYPCADNCDRKIPLYLTMWYGQDDWQEEGQKCFSATHWMPLPKPPEG